MLIAAPDLGAPAPALLVLRMTVGAHELERAPRQPVADRIVGKQHLEMLAEHVAAGIAGDQLRAAVPAADDAAAVDQVDAVAGDAVDHLRILLGMLAQQLLVPFRQQIGATRGLPGAHGREADGIVQMEATVHPDIVRGRPGCAVSLARTALSA